MRRRILTFVLILDERYGFEAVVLELLNRATKSVPDRTQFSCKRRDDLLLLLSQNHAEPIISLLIKIATGLLCLYLHLVKANL